MRAPSHRGRALHSADGSPHANAPPARARRSVDLGCAARFPPERAGLRGRRLTVRSASAARVRRPFTRRQKTSTRLSGRPTTAGRSYRRLAEVARGSEAAAGRARSGLLDLDLDVDAGGEVEALERLDRLARWARRCRGGACGSASRSARGSPCRRGASARRSSGGSRSAAAPGRAPWPGSGRPSRRSSSSTGR